MPIIWLLTLCYDKHRVAKMQRRAHPEDAPEPSRNMTQVNGPSNPSTPSTKGPTTPRMLSKVNESQVHLNGQPAYAMHELRYN
jgi:hypothetical protein